MRGSIQVSSDGVASPLLADHGTTGGYPKIATMLDRDVSSFAQNRPRGEVRFRAITPEAAVAIARAGGERGGFYREPNWQQLERYSI